ncbi:MAG TPA: TerC family protein [Pyrinomonadaceae bacterium]|jgi:tellurite resistance protein TerC
MNEIAYPWWAWIGFATVIFAALAIDLGLFNRKSHAPSYKETLGWSVAWVSMALIFNAVIFWQFGSIKGYEFLTGYLIELSLSIDNLFVFLLIFTYFQTPKKYQHRALFWGVFAALVMRLVAIFVGTTLVEMFNPVLYIFGAFLIYTGIKMFREDEAEIEPDKNPFVRLVTRFIPIVKRYEGDKFLIKENGKTYGTLLLLVLIVINVIDLVFAVDSIPAILGITTDRFIVYTSNVFAIMGLRTFFFLLLTVVEKFHFLRYGLAFVLTFIGVKMVLPLIGDTAAYLLNQSGNTSLAETVHHYEHIPINVSLGVVIVSIALSIVLSLVFPQERKEKIGDYETDIEEDYDFSDYNNDAPNQK